MKTNTAAKNNLKTHEGAPAAHLTLILQLRRSVLSCMLWEDTFYEDGQQIVDRIQSLVNQLNVNDVAAIAVEARTQFNLRHAPLFLAVALAKKGGRVVGQTIEQVIQRADELTEFLSIYWRNGKTPLSKQVKIGLSRAFRKFDGYALGKYNRDGKIKLRDVLFLVHAKPKDAEQAALWNCLVDGTLESPDTWEVALSSGADKKETFERLIREGKLGYLALLRNLRNMDEAGVDRTLVEIALIEGSAKSRALPFRFIAALRAAPGYANALNQALLSSLSSMERLSGNTVILIDVSGSMNDRLSAKSDLSRMDAAAALGSLLAGIAHCRVLTFSNNLCEVAGWNGLPLIDGIINSQPHGGTYLGIAINCIRRTITDIARLIVITDEQSHDRVDAIPGARNYMINVASSKNGVGYGEWVRIDGFSEAVIEYVRQYEANFSH